MPVKLDEDHKTTAFNMFNWELKQSQRHQQVAKQQLCRNCARASRFFLYFFVVVARPRRKTFLISRLVEEANSGLRFSIVF